MSILHDLMENAISLGASDVHLKPGKEPLYRINGELIESQVEALTPDYMIGIVKDVLPMHLLQNFTETHEADFSLQEEDVGRVRVNIFHSHGIPTIAMRHVKTDIPTFEELRVPKSLSKLAQWQRGVILLTGTTGSGKSTTLAAIIGEINRSSRRRVVTVEDPVEYLFVDDQSVITQREVGLDTLSFSAALKHLMRQDPDVVLIGEMRDATSIRTALLAAETGHLVLSTLHAGTASVAIPRILDVFPANEQEQILRAMAATDHAIICQRLIPDSHQGRIPAVEIMINTPTVRKLLEKHQLDVLSSAIETGREDGMVSFNQSIFELIKSGNITEADGLRFATNPESLRMNLQGIFLDEDRRILANRV